MNNTNLNVEWLTMCSNVPLIAKALCSASSPCIPTPTKINPIWETDEHANVLLKSIEKTASNAPKNIVTVPSKSINAPHLSSYIKILQAITKMPKIPVLVRIPDSNALAGAGATGCAFGSQI